MYFETDQGLSIKGELHPNQKLACFVLYLKIKKTNKQTNKHLLEK